MANPIQFYFDFASPYGYMAATRISCVAAKHGRGVEWKPFLLGVVFKVTGALASGSEHHGRIHTVRLRAVR